MISFEKDNGPCIIKSGHLPPNTMNGAKIFWSEAVFSDRTSLHVIHTKWQNIREFTSRNRAEEFFEALIEGQLQPTGFVRAQRVSFDFDDTLLMTKPDENGEAVVDGPNLGMVRRMRKHIDAGDVVFVVTTRKPDDWECFPEWSVHEFLARHGLNVDGVIFTSGRSKAPILEALQVEIHHDDDPWELRDLPPHIERVRVKTPNWHDWEPKHVKRCRSENELGQKLSDLCRRVRLRTMRKSQVPRHRGAEGKHHEHTQTNHVRRHRHRAKRSALQADSHHKRDARTGNQSLPRQRLA